MATTTITPPPVPPDEIISPNVKATAAPAPATGIVSAPAPTLPPAPPVPTVQPPTVQPTNWDVSKDQTVQGQIKGIVAADSPLMRQAATMAKQQANQRGLLNSSMAVGAGQNAVIQAALPIAQADAGTNAAAAKYNADAANATNQSNATFNMQAQQLNQSTALAQAQQIVDADVRERLMALEAKYKVGMQTSASMADTYNGLVNSITAIMSNPDMDAAAKQHAIDSVTQLYNSAFSTQEAISGLDLGDLLTFSAPAPGPSPSPSPAPAPSGAPAPAPFPESTGA